MRDFYSMEGNPLNSPERLLAAYAALLARSTRMLACVREQDWFTLAEEQSCYVVEVESLSRVEGAIQLSDEERDRKAELLECILEQDMEIRRRLLERRNELQKQIGVSQCKRDLTRSYGVRGGSDQGPP